MGVQLALWRWGNVLFGGDRSWCRLVYTLDRRHFAAWLLGPVLECGVWIMLRDPLEVPTLDSRRWGRGFLACLVFLGFVD